MKFLVRTMGWEAFRDAVLTEFAGVRETAPVPFDVEQPPIEAAPDWTRGAPPSVERTADIAAEASLRGPGILPRVSPKLSLRSEDLLRWTASNVRPQRQSGYVVVIIAPRLGDLTSTQLRVIGTLATAYGDGTVRLTMEQNLVLRWVRADDVDALYARLAAADLARNGAGSIADVVSCPGAESCRLAVTQSRGLGRLLADALIQRDDLVASLPNLDLKISGCPNGCGQHHIAGIGFQGSLRKVGDKAAPHYFVLIGGGTSEGVTTFGRVAATIPARRGLEAVERLAALYQAERAEGESAEAFFRRVDLAAAKAALEPIPRLTPETAAAEDFIDLGDDAAFELLVMDGECSA